MDARCPLLDATEVHFVIDNITTACIQKSSALSVQAWLLNQQMQEILLNDVSVDDASLDGLVPKELLRRLVDAANMTLVRMSDQFSAATKSLEKDAREADVTTSSASEQASTQDRTEEKKRSEGGHAPTEGQLTDEEPSACKPAHRRPAQEKLVKEIVQYSAEIEVRSKTNDGEDASRIVELKKLRAFSEERLKRLQATRRANSETERVDQVE